MAARDSLFPSASPSSCCKSSQDADTVWMDLIRLGQPIKYTIPEFNVITVNLRHVVVSEPELMGKVKDMDILLRDSTEFSTVQLPTSIKVLESCYCNKTHFLSVVDANFRDSVLVIWDWKWMAPSESQKSQNEETKSSVSSTSSPELIDSDPEEDYETQPTNHSIVFKCIGSCKNRSYQLALANARKLMSQSSTVPVKLVHEPYNQKDSKALAFVCKIGDKEHTIGYVVSELLDEVHRAINHHDIVSVELSWVQYITDWTKSGPGYFAGIKITKKGTWSRLAIKHSSTK